MEDSIFTQIVQGKIPAHKVYEDERTLAFMDIRPIQPGAVLVISKTQTDHVFDLSSEDYDALFRTVKQIGIALRRAFPACDRVGIVVEGFEVPHVHVKLVPVSSGTELRRLPDEAQTPDHTILAQHAQLIRDAMVD